MSAAVIAVVMGEGLKPLTTSQTPSENSQTATGRKPSASTVIWWSVRNRVVMTEAMSSGAPMSPEHGNDAGHEPGAVHQGAQQQGVDGWHEALPEQERPVVDRDVRRAGGDERGRIRSGRSTQVLSQGHQRQQADDADEDHAGFKDAGGRQTPARRLRSAA